jgi:hypothetical protein
MKKNNKGVIIALVLLIILCSVALVYLLMNNNNSITPDYASGVIDTNAIKEEESSEKKEYKTGGGSVNLKFSNVVEIDSSTKTAKLYFKNPGTSSEEIVLKLIIRRDEEEVVLGSSETIPPGYAIYKMDLDDVSMLAKGGYDGILKTIYYNEKTKVKEMVDSEIKVKIEVK